MKILSVIIPIYNTEIAILKKNLDAFVTNKGEQFEVILINDGSNEKVSDFLRIYEKKQNNFRLIEQNNLGVSAARNSGIEMAEGEWIAFCDADDEVNIEYLLKFAKSLNVDSEFGYSDYEKKRNNKIQTINLKTEKNSSLLVKKVLNIPNIYGTVWAKLFKRELLNKQNIRFRNEISHAEDTIFVLDYLDNVEKITHTDECFYRYIVSKESSSKQNPNALNKYLFSMKIIIEKYKNSININAAANFCVVNLLIVMVNYIWKKGVSFKEGKNILIRFTNSQEIEWALQNYDSKQLKVTNRLVLNLMRKKMYYACYLICQVRNQ